MTFTLHAAADPASQPATTTAGLSDAAMLTLIRGELGNAFDASRQDQILSAHAAIERYFAAVTDADRASVLAEIIATKIDINLLGPLCRIRRGWADLSPGTYAIRGTYGGAEVRYFLGLPPNYSRLQASPLVIVLPTADIFLTNPPPDNAGVAAIYQQWAKEEVDRQKDAIILLPLLNLDELYGPSKIGMASVIDAMRDAADRVNIDPARVDLIGHSIGGNAAWNIALHYPTYFAAIAPLAATANEDWQRLRLPNLSNVLPVAWADADDPVTPIAQVRSLIAAVRKQNEDVDYTETQKLGHAVPPQVLAHVIDAMRARRREIYPRQVAVQSNKPEPDFNRVDWLQIDEPIRPGADQRLTLPRGTGPMIVRQNTATARASIAENRVAITTDNVAKLRVFFNDRMLAFNSPVKIMVNGKLRYHDKLPASVEQMLNDQRFVGRGWRYFSAAVEIDLTQPALRE